MVIKRSPSGESAGDGRSTSKSTCVVLAWTLTSENASFGVCASRWSHQLTSDPKRCLLFWKCLQWSCLKAVLVPTFVLGGLWGSTTTSGSCHNVAAVSVNRCCMHRWCWKGILLSRKRWSTLDLPSSDCMYCPAVGGSGTLPAQKITANNMANNLPLNRQTWERWRLSIYYVLGCTWYKTMFDFGTPLHVPSWKRSILKRSASFPHLFSASYSSLCVHTIWVPGLIMTAAPQGQTTKVSSA